MFELILDSVFEHLFSEEMKEDARFCVIAPSELRLVFFRELMVNKLREWKLDIKLTSRKIEIEDITIEFVRAHEDMVRGKRYDYVFLLDSNLFNDKMNEIINIMRTFAVVIG